MQCARAGSNKLVHKWIANKGFRNVFVFALERVPIPNARSRETRKKLFNDVALVRELFWIRKLHSGRLRDNGLNTQGGTRQNKLHASKNPLKWRRQTLLKVKDDLVDLTVTTPVKGRRFMYRNWERRCKYLTSLIEKGKFDSDKLKLYKRQNLRCMLSWLERSKSMPSLQTCLNRELLLRYKFTEAKDSRDFSLRFTIPWHSSSLRKVGISSLLKNNELKNLLPNDFRKRIGSVMVCKKLLKPLSALLHNSKFEAKNLLTT